MKQLYQYAPLSKSRGKFPSHTRNYVSDFDGNSSVARKKTRGVNGDRLKLVEVGHSLAEPVKKNRNRLYSYYQKQPEDQEFDKVKNDVLRLQQQVLLRKHNLKNRANQYLPYSPLRTRTLPQQIQVPQRSSYQLRKRFFENEGKIWQYNNQLSPHAANKLYKIKKRPKRFLFDTNDQDQSLNHSIIDYATLNRSRRRNISDQLYFERPLIYKVRHPPNISRIFRSSKNVHKFKRVGNVILFIIRLRTYNQRMRIRRFGIFQKFVKGELNQKLLQLKNELIYYSKPLFSTLADQQNFNYRLHEKDEPILKRQKINSVCKLVKLQIKYLQKFINQATNRQTFTQLFYILCKHGNYTCTEELNTAEQLNLTCISQFYGYLRADKYLQISALLSLVFIKMLLYNIFLQPERVDIINGNRASLKVIFTNLKLIGNILYELFIEIQDEILERPPAIYTIGNWNNLKNTFKFKIAESMTIRPGFFQNNELISGLASSKYIRDIYGTKSMVEQRQILKATLKKMHQTIVDYHQKFRKESFVR